jgi:NADH dehydrogenase FAD-containing subunit
VLLILQVLLVCNCGHWFATIIFNEASESIPRQRIDIILISKDNFFLFTPVLSEVSSSDMIETCNIVTSLEYFVKDKFYEANVKPKDLKNNDSFVINYAICKHINYATQLHSHTLKYDCLVWQKALLQIATNLSLIVQAP